jgi:hypothetical protein
MGVRCKNAMVSGQLIQIRAWFGDGEAIAERFLG